MTLRIGLVGDRNESVVAHRAIPVALDLAAAGAGVEVELEWLGTETIDASAPDLSRFSALWCVPASPYRSAEGAIAAIRFAREHGVPFLGTCAGFQHALLEIAHSLWGVDTAGHAELDPDALDPVIAPLECSLAEQGGVVHFRPGSRLAKAYGAPSAEEEYHCSYGFNARYRHHLDEGPLRVTAWDDDGDVRGVELDGHPFFVATLFQPERAGLRGRVPPIVAAYLAAAASEATPIPILETDRLVLRPFSANDAPRVQELAGASEVASTTLTIPHPYPAGAAEGWISGHGAEWRAGRRLSLAVTTSAEGLVGAMGLHISARHRRAELGYWIGVPFWGRGYATEAATRVVEYAFDELGLHRVVAHHLTRNPASGRVLLKLGMAHEGTFRQHIVKADIPEDIEAYGVLRSEWKGGNPR